MNLKSNRDDFEEALSDMKETIEAMEPCIDEVLLNTLKTVVEEYEEHYRRDIENLITERDELQEKVKEEIQ